MELLAKGLDVIVAILTIIFSAFVLAVTIMSHHYLHKYRKDTVGRKAYRWLLGIFALCGICFGFVPAAYLFVFAAVISERLLIYRACRSNKDWLGRFLVKINW